MAWCHQVSSHYISQSLPISMSQYGTLDFRFRFIFIASFCDKCSSKRTHYLILLSTLTSVASDLFNYALRLNNELSARPPRGRHGLWTGLKTQMGCLENRLMKPVVLTICNFCFSGTDHSKFYSDMLCALPETYEKFQWVFHHSFWITTNWIKHVLEGNLRAFTPAH